MSSSGRWIELTATPVRWSNVHGIPNPTAATSRTRGLAHLLDRVDGGVEEGRLVETGQPSLRAVMDPRPASTAPASSLVPPMSTPMVRRAGIWRHYMQSRMSDDPDNRAQSDDPPYRVYRGSESSRTSTEPRPYTVYRSRPRGLRARLRGEEDADLRPAASDPRAADATGERADGGWTIARRVLKYVAIAVVAWLLLSLVLFIISAQIEQGNLPDSAKSALTSGGNMLTSTDTVLIIGTDQRPKGSKEPGANTNDAGSRSDTLMLWRIGGGTSRRLSIPRDTVANDPRPRPDEDQRRLRARRSGADDPHDRGSSPGSRSTT